MLEFLSTTKGSGNFFFTITAWQGAQGVFLVLHSEVKDEHLIKLCGGGSVAVAVGFSDK